MGPECKVCADPRVADIDRALTAPGASVRGVAKSFTFPPTTMQRHDAHRRGAGAVTSVVTLPAPVSAPPEEAPAPGPEVRRPCLACRSPFRDELEAALLRGEPAEALERAYAGRGGPSADTLRRHAVGCIQELIRTARDGRIAALCDEAARRIRELAEEAGELVRDAKEGTARERAACLSAASRVFELLGKITGELGPDVEIKILELPQWSVLQEAILAALRPFPEARAAVLEALRGVERGPRPQLTG